MSFLASKRVLAVMAHPDDIEFMAGGAIARWASEGVELHYCLLTDGNSGSRDPNLTPARLAELRRAEQKAAGDLANVASYTFLGEPDGRLINTVELRLKIARVIRQVQPDTILTCDARFFYGPNYLNHPDHRAAAETTMAAIMPLANTRLAAPELLEEDLEPHDVSLVYIASPVEPNHWVSYGEDDMERKIAMIEAHATQVGGGSGWDYRAMIKQFAQRGAEQARANGIEAEYAEAFYVVNLVR